MVPFNMKLLLTISISFICFNYNSASQYQLVSSDATIRNEKSLLKYLSTSKQLKEVESTSSVISTLDLSGDSGPLIVNSIFGTNFNGNEGYIIQ